MKRAIWTAQIAGGVVTAMFHRSSFVAVVAVLLTTVCLPARAQDRLAELMAKATIERHDRAVIEAEVPERVSRLRSAGADAKRRAAAVDRIIRPAKTQGATRAALDVYAEVCSRELNSLVTGDAFETAFDSVQVLVELDNANTAEALAAAMSSKHAAIRYRAAGGIQRLQGRLKDNLAAGRAALRALGQAGAVEADDLALRMIYEAIDAYAEAKGTPFADDCAWALNKIFAKRIADSASVYIDLAVDEPGFKAASACYAGAGEEQRKDLISNVYALLSHAVDRYFDPATYPDFRPVLLGLIKTMEDGVTGMIRSSNQSPPSKGVYAAVSARGRDAQKQANAGAALQALKDVLRGSPWNIR